MKNIDLLTDISNITSISNNTLKDICHIAKLIISDSVSSAQVEQNGVIEFDIGIGKLYIKSDSDKYDYRFVINEDLQSMLSKNRTLSETDLCKAAEKSLDSKILSIYKELL